MTLMSEIISSVADGECVSRDEILGRSRHKYVVNARHLAMYTIRCELGVSYKQIARAFGRADHTSVIHACRRVSGDPRFFKKLSQMKANARLAKK